MSAGPRHTLVQMPDGKTYLRADAVESVQVTTTRNGEAMTVRMASGHSHWFDGLDDAAVGRLLDALCWAAVVAR